MFTQEELRNLALVLNRADIKGNEALGMVILIQKVNNLLKAGEEKKEDKPLETPKEEPKKEVKPKE